MDTQDALGKVNTEVAAVAAWYKAKPLYAGAVIGFVLGQALAHWLHF